MLELALFAVFSLLLLYLYCPQELFDCVSECMVFVYLLYST